MSHLIISSHTSMHVYDKPLFENSELLYIYFLLVGHLTGALMNTTMSSNSSCLRLNFSVFLFVQCK